MSSMLKRIPNFLYGRYREDPSFSLLKYTTFLPFINRSSSYTFSTSSPKHFDTPNLRVNLSEYKTKEYKSEKKGKKKIRNILITKKKSDKRSSKVANTMIEWLREEHSFKHSNILVEPNIAMEIDGGVTYSVSQQSKLSKIIDLVILLGGDGTMIHLSRIFPGKTPPIIGFSMGTASFLAPFKPNSWKSSLAEVLRGEYSILARDRLEASVHKAGELEALARVPVLNEIALSRGEAPVVIHLETQLNGSFFTNVIGDGLILSTPSGATAYSLSSMGPFVHPALKAILMTPISPLSLSFRPILVPHDVDINIKLSSTSRTDRLLVSFDGDANLSLCRQDSVHAKISKYPLNTIIAKDVTQDWMNDINSLLKLHLKKQLMSPD